MLSPNADCSRRQKLGLPLVVLASCLAATAVSAPSAVAAAGGGSVKLTLGGSGKAAKSLTAEGVKISALAPAKKRGRRVTLPVQSVTVGKAATISLRGGIGFKAGRRTLKLKSAKLKLTAAKATVTVKAGKLRVPVFTAKLAKGKAKLDRAGKTAKLAGATLALTSKGAKLLRTKLAVSDVAAGALGRLAVDAKPKSASGGGTKPGGGGGGTKPKPKSACGVGPEAGELPAEPPVATRPAGAQDVTTASLTWRPRESWIRYINGGDGTSVSGGFTNGPAEPYNGITLVYSFLNSTLVPGKSWAHPDGRAALYFAGGVKFSWMNGPMPHCINFTASDPEIEIAPAGGSRSIFRFNGSDGTPFPNRRGVLVNLALGAGTNGDYPNMIGTLPDGMGSSVFAGLYGPGDEFGTISVVYDAP
jgi:hypothetical protein